MPGFGPPPGGGSGGAAGSLQTTGAPVVVSTAAPPAVGDVLTATSATTADWESPGALVNNLKIATVTLSGAQLAAINTTGVTAVAAPGAGKYSNLGVSGQGVAVQTTVGTTPYTVYGTLVIKGFYSSTSGVSALSGYEVDAALGTDFIQAMANAADSGLSFGTKSAFNNQPIVLIASVADSTGRITASNVNVANPGLLYAPGDTGTVNGASDTAAQYVVDTVDIGGSVLTYHLSNQGTQIPVANAVGTTPNTGMGDGNFKIDITAIQSVSTGDGTLTLTIPYIVVTLQ